MNGNTGVENLMYFCKIGQKEAIIRNIFLYLKVIDRCDKFTKLRS